MKSLIVGTLSALVAITAAQASQEGVVPDTPAARATRAVAPQLFAYTQDVLFGDLWKRKELAPRDRSMVTLSALVANGQSEQMTSHVNLALDNGVKPSEIVALITHLAFYTGWPNAMSAVGVTNNVFSRRGLEGEHIRPEAKDALPVDKASEARRAAIVRENVAPVAPDLARYTDDVLFADLWRKADLASRDRSLVTMAALIARGQAEQLPFHLNRAMDSGLTQAQASEVITHLAFYTGWPRAMSAIPVAKTVFDARR
jgi:4-carboxymuconolactone decarboxylase